MAGCRTKEKCKFDLPAIAPEEGDYFPTVEDCSSPADGTIEVEVANVLFP